MYFYVLWIVIYIVIEKLIEFKNVNIFYEFIYIYIV